MRSEKRQLVYSAIDIERRIQERLKAEGRFQYTCSDKEMSNPERLTVLAEEFGEVAHEVNEGISYHRSVDLEKLRKELVQTAAVAVAWLETSLERETVFDDVDTEIVCEVFPAGECNRFSILADRFSSVSISSMMSTPLALEWALKRFAAVCVLWISSLDDRLTSTHERPTLRPEALEGDLSRTEGSE